MVMEPVFKKGRGLLDICTAIPYTWKVQIRSIDHRGLKRLIEDDDDREIGRDLVKRIRRILTALIAAENMAGVEGPPGWRIHLLTGDRAGTWSISASGNWRITFELDGVSMEHLNLEDYH